MVEIGRRLLQFIPVFFGVTALVFCLLRLAPGDAARIKLRDRGQDLSAEALRAVRSELGLDRPLWVQYGRWLRAAARLDLGNSIMTREPVARELGRRFRVTVRLTLPVILLVLAAAFPLGLLGARFQGRFWDWSTRIGAVTGMSVPPFCLGLLGVLVFSVRLGWLPSFGTGTPAHYIMPCLALALPAAAHYTRFIRSVFLEELSKEYVRAARARGLGPGGLLIFHCMKNALVPLVTSLGMTLALMLGGSAVVEKVFSWPGMGACLIDAVLNRDYPLVQGCALVYAFLFAGINLLTDLLCIAVDPKLRRARQMGGAGGPLAPQRGRCGGGTPAEGGSGSAKRWSEGGDLPPPAPGTGKP